MGAAAQIAAAAAAQPAAAVAQPQVHSKISISQPEPFFSHPGDPSLPWRTWFVVFETYLLPLEEERGTPLSNLTKNSLLFGLLGTEGHKHFSGNPMIETLNMATYADFLKAVMEHFQLLVNTAHAISDL